MCAATNSATKPDIGSDEIELRAIFNDYGLPLAEAIVFSTLLRLGTKQASAIAKYSGVSRAHVYGILDRLRERGFVSSHERDGVLHFTSISVKQLVASFASRENILASRRKQLEKLVSRFRATDKTFWSDPVTHSTRGAEARATLFRQINSDIEETRYLFCSISSSILFEELPPSIDAIKHLLHLGGTQLRLVMFGNNRTAEEFRTELDTDSVRFSNREFPGEFLVSKNSMTIFGTKQSACRLMTIEQQAFAEIFLHFAQQLFTVEPTQE